MTHEAGLYTLSYGVRPGLANTSYRICQRCNALDGTRVRADYCLVHPRRWWQVFPKQELLCVDCADPDQQL